MSNVQGPKSEAFGVAETEADRQGTAGKAQPVSPHEVMRRRLVARLPSSLQDQTTLAEWTAWCDCLAACIVDGVISWDAATGQHPIGVCGEVYRKNAGRAARLKSLVPKVEPEALELWQGGKPQSQATRKQVQDALTGRFSWTELEPKTRDYEALSANEQVVEGLLRKLSAAGGTAEAWEDLVQELQQLDFRAEVVRRPELGRVLTWRIEGVNSWRRFELGTPLDLGDGQPVTFRSIDPAAGGRIRRHPDLCREPLPAAARDGKVVDVEQTVTTSDGCSWPYHWDDHPERGMQGTRVLFVNDQRAGELDAVKGWQPAPPSSAWARPCLVCAGEGCDACADTGKRGKWSQDSGGACYVPELRDPPNPDVATTSIELGKVSAEKAAELIGVLGQKSDAEDAALKVVEKLLPPEEAGNPMIKGMQAKHLRWLLGRVRSLKENGAALLQRCEHLEREAQSQSLRAQVALDELARAQGQLDAEQCRHALTKTELREARKGSVSTELRVTDDGMSDRESFLRCTYRDLVVHQGEKPRQAAKLALEAWEAIPELLEGGAS